MDTRLAWFGLSLVTSLSPKRLQALIAAFADPVALWSADSAALRSAGADPRVIEALVKARTQLDLSAQLAQVSQVGAQVITLVDADYPPLLRQIADPPPALYVRGSLNAEDVRALAIIGTRRATTYGRDVTNALVRGLVAAGVTIISGLAFGVDAYAHRAALDHDGRTLAIMGCGIDRIYPQEHADIARRIARQGALVTEFPVGSKAQQHHFPQRNRVMSGMALGVLVIEASEKSGTFITVNAALEQGREVFAVPGGIFSPASSGTNRLIQEGAKLITRVDDILEEIDAVHQQAQGRALMQEVRQAVAAVSAPIDALEAALLDLLKAEARTIDELVLHSQLSAAQVTSTLTMLELQGYIEADGRGGYRALPQM